MERKIAWEKYDDLKVVFKRNVDGVSDMTRNRPVKEREFNHIIDEAFENNPEGNLGEDDISNLASALVNKAFDDVISDTLNKNNEENTQKFETNDNNIHSDIENNDVDAKNPQNFNNPSTSPDGITYYEGIDDVNSPLRKNNLYYDGDKHKNKSVKDSIRSGIRDIKYIRKSLNEIENPTQVGYVSVVDRTEEYDENDYLTPIQDYEGEEYVQKRLQLNKDLEREIAEKLPYLESREIKKIDKGQVHIKSSFNNTIITITDANGNTTTASFCEHCGYYEITVTDAYGNVLVEGMQTKAVMNALLQNTAQTLISF